MGWKDWCADGVDVLVLLVLHLVAASPGGLQGYVIPLGHYTWFIVTCNALSLPQGVWYSSESGHWSFESLVPVLMSQFSRLALTLQTHCSQSSLYREILTTRAVPSCAV
jgi:hypothetical protein